VTYPAAVTIAAPARLHLGFLDLNGGLGRRFGSVGLAIEAFATRLRLSRADAPSVTGADELSRAQRLLAVLGQAWDLPPVRVEILETIPAHRGLGSGTQLGLALGVSLARLFGRVEGPRDVARLIERGARSGIGVGVFTGGGFLLDGGKGMGDDPPPVLSRLYFPEAWRVLLVLDSSEAGLSGQAERSAFAALPPFPAEIAAHLCRLTLMRLLPAVAEADLDAVGPAVAELQRRVGDHFAPAQGGRFTSLAVARVLAWFEAEGIPGVGQSSWGPTGFALLPDAVTAERVKTAAERRFAAEPGLSFAVTTGRNRGADISLE
jgi:beta-ribofuranosylaminobenzene 5'-phosphate synthase